MGTVHFVCTVLYILMQLLSSRYGYAHVALGITSELFRHVYYDVNLAPLALYGLGGYVF